MQYLCFHVIPVFLVCNLVFSFLYWIHWLSRSQEITNKLYWTISQSSYAIACYNATWMAVEATMKSWVNCWKQCCPCRCPGGNQGWLWIMAENVFPDVCPLEIAKWMKWYRIAMCFICGWLLGFLAREIAPWLLPKRLIGRARWPLEQHEYRSCIWPLLTRVQGMIGVCYSSWQLHHTWEIHSCPSNDVCQCFQPNLSMCSRELMMIGHQGYCTISINSSITHHRATWWNEIWSLSQVTRPLDERVVCHRDLDKVIFTEIWVFSVMEHQFWFLQCTIALNSTHNTAEMARQKAAPDKILPMSQASRRSDEKKISSGMSQSRRGDELIEIVQ